MGEVKKAFNPEFLNRLDEVILFTSLSDEDLLKIMGLLAEQINVNLVAKQIKIRLNDGRRQVHPRKDLRRPQLRRPSAAPRASEIHRGSAQRSADPRLAAAPRGARSLPGRRRHLLPPLPAIAGAAGGRPRRRSQPPRWPALRSTCSDDLSCQI